MNENTLLLNKPLIHLGIFLEDFIHTSSFPATITCAKTGKYLVLNQVICTRDGIPNEDYVGLTAHNIAEVMHYKPDIIDNVTTTNYQIHIGELPYKRYKQIMPIQNGSICIEEVIKKPILSNTNKVIGILGCGREITPCLNLMHLFKVYQQYYSNKEAIRRFIQYIKLSEVFYELPTRRELEVLLTMRQSTAAKDVGKVLRLTPKTIEENKARLRNHLKNITLGELVMKLRQHHELKNEIFR